MKTAKDKMIDPILHCSFCGKSQHNVTKLIAGPAVYICDGCVDLCNKILAKPLDEINLTEAPNIEELKSMTNDRLLNWLRTSGAVFECTRNKMQEIVELLREREVSWAVIGMALGVSRQAAWDRFS